MADATLGAIRTKVRRLTRSLSETQLSTTQIDEYINTFVLYDFPEHLRLFNLRRTFSFYTDPYVDTYETSSDATSPLYEFKNKYISVHAPVYIAGYRVLFSEDRTQFYGRYPLVNGIVSVGTGDGVTTAFTGTIPSTGVASTTSQVILLRNNVLISSIDTSGNGLSMIDYPISSSLGNLYAPGGTPTSTTVQDANNYVNYLTGQFVVTFAIAPESAKAINSQTVRLQPSMPKTLLFFDGKFVLRPVPDQPYRVDMEVYVRPTELLSAAQEPGLQEWWQFIAYGASRKVFQDRMDVESLQMIEPEYKKQENLILRRTIVQQTSQRTTTIYTNRTSGSGFYNSGWSPGSSSY